MRIPLVDVQSEFDSQVLALTKILVDSLNEEKIQEQLSTKIKGEKGISKFERFLSTKGFTDYQPHIKFLRDLQSLRSSGSAHRKGEEFRKVATRFSLEEKTLTAVFEEILDRATRFLEYLRDKLL
ncbi:hypothetical protein HY009_03360 [Candidatus Acetothermia bacterium]|nr:hypothetical protein [Candidatus Acetothermia bacterium]